MQSHTRVYKFANTFVIVAECCETVHYVRGFTFRIVQIIRKFGEKTIDHWRSLLEITVDDKTTGNVLRAHEPEEREDAYGARFYRRLS